MVRAAKIDNGKPGEGGKWPVDRCRRRGLQMCDEGGLDSRTLIEHGGVANEPQSVEVWPGGGDKQLRRRSPVA